MVEKKTITVQEVDKLVAEARALNEANHVAPMELQDALLIKIHLLEKAIESNMRFVTGQNKAMGILHKQIDAAEKRLHNHTCPHCGKTCSTAHGEHEEAGK
jgi:hypothetical protein